MADKIAEEMNADIKKNHHTKVKDIETAFIGIYRNYFKSQKPHLTGYIKKNAREPYYRVAQIKYMGREGICVNKIVGKEVVIDTDSKLIEIINLLTSGCDENFVYKSGTSSPAHIVENTDELIKEGICKKICVDYFLDYKEDDDGFETYTDEELEEAHNKRINRIFKLIKDLLG